MEILNQPVHCCNSMKINRSSVINFIFFFGPLVLVSYLYGFSHMDDPTVAWGGVPLSWQTYIVPFMFVAAFGFLMYWWIAFFQLDEKTLQSFRWPWGKSDGQGLNRLLLAYAIFLIPSSFWLESTIYHINHDTSWTPILPISILTIVTIGNVMLGLLAYSAHKDGIKNANLMFIGSIMLGIQCIPNDWIIWIIKFPW